MPGCNKLVPIHTCPVACLSYYICYLTELGGKFFLVTGKPCTILNNPCSARFIKRLQVLFLTPCSNKRCIFCNIFCCSRHPVVKVCLDLKEFPIFIIKGIEQIIDKRASYQNYLYVYRYRLWLKCGCGHKPILLPHILYLYLFILYHPLQRIIGKNIP